MSEHRLPPRFLDLLESAGQRGQNQFFTSLLASGRISASK